MLLVLRVRLLVQTNSITMPCAHSKLQASLCHPCVLLHHCRQSTAGSPVNRPQPRSLSLNLYPDFTLPKSASQMPRSKQLASLDSARQKLFLLPTQCPAGVLQALESLTRPEDLLRQTTATRCDRILPSPSHKRPAGQPSTSAKDQSAPSTNTILRMTHLNQAPRSDPS